MGKNLIRSFSLPSMVNCTVDDYGFSNEELIEKIRENHINSKKYHEILIKKNLILCYHTLRKIRMFKYEIFDYDDLFSITLLGMLKAIEQFDPSRNIKFSTFASFKMHNAVLDLMRTYERKNSKNNLHIDGSLGYDSPNSSFYELLNDKDNTIDNLVVTKTVIRDIFNKLSERKKLILSEKMKGRTLKQIAEKVGISEIAISYNIRVIRQKMAKELSK